MIDREYARRELAVKETDELLDILVARDEEDWSPEVHPIVEEVLRERGVSVAEAVEARRHEAPPPSVSGLVEPPADRPAVLAQFDDEREAKLCSMALVQAGIEARVHDPSAGVFEILVDESELDTAQSVLDAAEVADDDDGEPGFRCQSCGFIADPIQEDGRLVCQVCGEAS